MHKCKTVPCRGSRVFHLHPWAKEQVCSSVPQSEKRHSYQSALVVLAVIPRWVFLSESRVFLLNNCTAVANVLLETKAWSCVQFTSQKGWHLLTHHAVSYLKDHARDTGIYFCGHLCSHRSVVDRCGEKGVVNCRKKDEVSVLKMSVEDRAETN